MDAKQRSDLMMALHKPVDRVSHERNLVTRRDQLAERIAEGIRGTPTSREEYHMRMARRADEVTLADVDAALRHLKDTGELIPLKRAIRKQSR
jgi:hypothetical protein